MDPILAYYLKGAAGFVVVVLFASVFNAADAERRRVYDRTGL